jgi:hypothetical protein
MPGALCSCHWPTRRKITNLYETTLPLEDQPSDQEDRTAWFWKRFACDNAAPGIEVSQAIG